MSTGTRDAVDVLEKLIRLCDDLAWGRPADENAVHQLDNGGLDIAGQFRNFVVTGHGFFLHFFFSFGGQNGLQDI